jgi:hypothetical protein
VWWSYFVVPTGDILHARPERSFSFGYGHMALFGSIVAIGAGLHVGAYYLKHAAHLGLVATVLTVAVPVALFTVLLATGYGVLTRTFDSFHIVLLVATAAVVAASVLMAAAGAGLVWCLLVLSAAPWVTVVGYETVGYRHHSRVLAALSD